MPCITYGKDKKELGVIDPKTLEYLLKQRLAEMNANNDKKVYSTKENYKSPIKVEIYAPTVKEFFAKKK
jgi:hypothetical protein